MTDVRTRCAANISAARERANLSQGQLAAELGVKQQAVSSWERGITVPSLERLDDLARVLNLHACDLLAELAA